MDDDDLPLSALIAKKSNTKSSNGHNNDKNITKKLSESSSKDVKSGKAESDEDQPVAALIAKKRAINGQSTSLSSSSHDNSKSQAKKPAFENSDSEDEMPFVAIIKKREREQEAAEASQDKKKRKKSSDNNDSKSSSSSRTPAAPKPQSRSGSAGVTAEFYDDTSKGQIIQTLMLRWWYAFEWPIRSEIPSPPDGYESLDGYPGVFVSTRTDTLGEILDLRNPDTCPNLINLIKKPSRELKELCMKALEEQIKALMGAEGEDVRAAGSLKSDLAAIKAINADKADREAEKYERVIAKLAADLAK